MINWKCPVIFEFHWKHCSKLTKESDFITISDRSTLIDAELITGISINNSYVGTVMYMLDR